jgi:hypothetical protein
VTWFSARQQRLPERAKNAQWLPFSAHNLPWLEKQAATAPFGMQICARNPLPDLLIPCDDSRLITVAPENRVRAGFGNKLL